MLALHRSLLLAVAAAATCLGIETTYLQAEGLIQPLGLPTYTPLLTWVPISSTKADNQTAYQVQASADATFSNVTFWDTGKTASSALSVEYAGTALRSRDRVYWRVRAWDATDTAGAWSPATWFELSLMEQSDWTASWIENTQYDMGVNGLPMFAKDFNVTCTPTVARWYLLGLGVQWGELNGETVTDQLLTPSYSTMNTSLFYSSYDITSQLAAGANTIGVELGKGSYDAYPGLDGRYSKFTAAGAPLPLKLISQLEYTCPSGERNTIVSDSTWATTSDGPWLEASWYGGYEYDATRAIPGAFLPGFDRSSWEKANVTSSPYSTLNPQLLSPEMPPLKIVETFEVQDIAETAISYVFDLGQNFAGWYNFTFTGTRGQRITIWPGERLLANGSVDQSTMGSTTFDGYTFSGNGTESLIPKFLYHGQRYLEVRGLGYTPATSDITGYRIRFDALKTGTFESSDDLFNGIHKIIDQAIQNNMYSVLTDCPAREKMGWLDQDHLAIDPVLFGYDLRGFGRHMMKQIVDAQGANGDVPTTAPQFTEFGSWPPYGDAYDQEPNWGLSIVLFAHKHYKTYGDISILSDHYAAMKTYVEYLNAQNATSHILTVGLGDWEAPDSTTPYGLTSTGGFAQGVGVLAEIASILGETSDAAEYSALHGEIVAAFASYYYNDTDGVITYASGSQCSDVMALDIGAVPKNLTSSIYDHLITNIRDNGTHFSVGETCLPPFFRTLSSGHNDLLYEIMSSTTTPSYGWEVVNGATSLTETWNALFGSGSLDHLMLGYGDTWLYGLAGISQPQGSFAWTNIDYSPVIVGNLKYANASFYSVRGLVAGAWQSTEEDFSYTVTVPVGSTGTVYLPGLLVDAQVDGAAINGSAGVVSSKQSGNQTVVVVGSGTYAFTI